MITLRDLRVNYNFTQDELATLFGVTRDSIIQAEKDSSNVKYSLLTSYLVAFNVELDEIYLNSKHKISVIYERRKEAAIANIQKFKSQNTA